MTAYEELKAWCEKHLASHQYIDTLVMGRFSMAQDAIVFPNYMTIIFDHNGNIDYIDCD